MKSSIFKLLSLVLFLTISLPVWAQDGAQDADGSRLLLVGIIALVAGLIFAVVLVTADNLLNIEGREVGIKDSDEEANLGIIPTGRELFRKKTPEYIPSGRGIYDLEKGMDILLEGNIENSEINAASVNSFAVQPTDFIGIAPIPKMLVEVGQEVKAGDPLFYNKANPDIKYVSPVSGEVAAVNRGAKRAITEVIVLADKNGQQYRQLDRIDLHNCERADLVAFLKESGAWPLIRQRPFNLIADPELVPDNIFISTFDTAPLAPDLNVIVQGHEPAFQAGLDALSRLTDGSVYLGLDARGENAPAKAFTEATGVEKRWFRGKHPAGNVGVQIHHIAPLHAASNVWTLDVQTVITIGKLFIERRFDASRVVAVVGQQVEQPQYIATLLGANVDDLLRDNLKEGNNRTIAGDVLTGKQVNSEGFLGAFDDQVTVIPEGDYYEMFGWLVPQTMRPTNSNTYFSSLISGLRYETDTNTHGEKRAFVMTGQYEDVVPMDIYPQQLLKSILVQDFEQIEGLGIYEVVEEDLALCEFVCTSKQPVQQILRNGIEFMRDQM